MTKKQRKMLTRIIAAAVLLGTLLLLDKFGVLPENNILRFVLFMIPYIIIGCDILIKAGKGIITGSSSTRHF